MADRLKMAIGDLIGVGAGIRAVVAWVRDRGAPLGDGVAVYLLSGSERRAQRRARHDVGLGSKASMGCPLASAITDASVGGVREPVNDGHAAL